MDAHDAYTRELHEAFGYFATWLPTAPVTLGEVGRLQGKRFERLGTLADFGVRFAVSSPRIEAELQHASEGKVEIKLESAADTTIVAGAGNVEGVVTVGFSAKHAVFFRALQCAGTSIKDLKQVGDAIVNLAANGRWDRANLVVTEVVSAGRATILMASESGAKFSLGISGGSPIDGIDLLSASAGQFQHSSGLSLKIQANGGLTPLFKVGRLRRRFLGTEFRMRGDDREECPPSGPELLAEIDLSDIGATAFTGGDADFGV